MTNTAFHGKTAQGLSRAVLLCFLCPRLLVASVTDMLIPTLTDQDQQRVHSARLSDHRVVFVWEDHSGDDADIRFRLFDPERNELGDSGVAHVGRNGNQTDPAVAGLPNGRFVVAFATTAAGSANHDILFQLLSNEGTVLSEKDLPASDSLYANELHPEVSVLRDGFVIAWADQSSTDQDIAFRRFDQDGRPLDSQPQIANAFGVNPVQQGDQGGHRVVRLAEDQFLIVYEDRAKGDVYGVQFDADGNPLDVPGAPAGSKQFRLNLRDDHDQWHPGATGFEQGGFAITFNSETNGTSASRRVLGRVFSAKGVGSDEFVIGDHPDRWQDAHVASFSDGFLATWQARDASSPPLWAVYAQPFDGMGRPVLSQFRVNLDNANHRDRPVALSLPGDGFALAWQSLEQDGSGLGIYARRVAALQPFQGALSITRASQGGTPAAHVRFQGPPHETYEIQRSMDYTIWTTLLTTNSPTGLFGHFDPILSAPPYPIFRVERKLTP